MDTPWKIRHVQKRDWGHHPAEKDQLLEFLKISSPPFDCWAIDVDHSSSEQSINLSQRHNRADETIRMSVTAPSTKLFFPIGRQRRNSVVNSNSSLDGRRCTSGHFQPQFLLRETKGPNRKKWFNIFFSILFLPPISNERNLWLLLIHCPHGASMELARSRHRVKFYQEFRFMKDIWSRYYSEYYSFYVVGGLNKRCTSSNASNLTRLNATPKSFFSVGSKRQSFMSSTPNH